MTRLLKFCTVRYVMKGNIKKTNDSLAISNFHCTKIKKRWKYKLNSDINNRIRYVINWYIIFFNRVTFFFPNDTTELLTRTETRIKFPATYYKTKTFCLWFHDRVPMSIYKYAYQQITFTARVKLKPRAVIIWLIVNIAEDVGTVLPHDDFGQAISWRQVPATCRSTDRWR